jgi:hypothetical protein
MRLSGRSFMKSTSPIKNLMPIICLLCFLILSGGCISKDGSSSVNQSSSEIDSTCEIQQLNLSIVHNQTIVSITKEDLSPFPEFATYMYHGDNNPPARNSGMRVVKVIDCNASRAIQFLTLYRKYEEFPNQPVLEYEGRYYKVGFDEYDSHSTARPTTVATPVSMPIPVPPALSQRTGGDYCYINELQSDFLRDSVIIPLTSKELEKFPEYRTVIIQSANNSRKWINGYRFAGDFTDYQHQISDFRNLSCRNISYEECRVRQVPVVYEFNSQFYEVACLQDFGGAHRSREK